MKNFLPICLFLALAIPQGYAQRDSRQVLLDYDLSVSSPKAGYESENLDRLRWQPIDRKKPVVLDFEVGQLPFEHATPFIAFSTAWGERTPQVENTHLMVSFSPDGHNWGPWERLQPDEHAVGIRHSFASNLLFKEKTQRYYRIRAISNRLAQGIVANQFLFNFFSPGEETGSASLKENLEKSDPASSCLCPIPAFVNRKEWNCPQGEIARGYTTVTHLIVHHSAGTNVANDWGAIVLAIWNLHVFTNGWADVGYNWLIDPNGKLYEGRGGGDNVTGAHFCGTNSGTMGVCMLGTYTSSQITTAAKNKLIEVLAWKACQRAIAPIELSYHNSSQKFIYHISGHRDGCSTECPGEQVYRLLPEIRAAVASYAQACASATPILEISGISRVQLSPNPLQSLQELALEFTLDHPMDLSYRVLNVQGQVLLESERARFPSGANRIPVVGLPQGLPQGLHFVQIVSGDRSITRSVVF
jgi:hypothetical protein